MKRKIEKLILMLLVLMAARLLAQPYYELNDSVSERILFLKDLPVLIDSTNALSFEQINSAGYLSKFRVNPDYQNKDFNEYATYWIQIPLVQTESKRIWILEFFDQTIDELEVFSPSGDGKYQVHDLGDHQPFKNRENLHKNFTVTINNVNDTVHLYYARIRSHEFADIRIALRSYSRFIYYALNEYFLFGTFYGMVLIIILYNLLVYLAIREGKYIYYIFYIFSVALYAMSYDGIAFQYLWPNSPGWNDYASGIMLFSVILWATLFTRRFLDTRVEAPLLDKILLITISVRSLIFLIFLFFKPTLFSLRALDIIPLSIIFYTGVYTWNNGFKAARFFLIAYGCLFLGFFIRSLVYFNIVPFTTISHYSLHFSFVLEMLFLTFALGDRIRILKANQDQALRETIEQHKINLDLKEKVNRELEAKVKERTLELNAKNAELETSNNRLLKQASEINKINSILDLDNWKLKNRVKEVLNEMLLDQTMTYDEFKMLYPDTLSCLRFLEDYKWKKGFKCHKCGNSKYFNGIKKFSRRCSRCGYNESVTSYTVFHGIKFPLEKAFYIAYLSVASKEKETLTSLAEKLNLTINTVHSFRTKLKHALQSLNDQGKKPTAKKWEMVIGEAQIQDLAQ